MEKNKLVVRKIYKVNNQLAYYCGQVVNGSCSFELIEFEGIARNEFSVPSQWISLGNDTYWCYHDIHNYAKELTDEEINEFNNKLKNKTMEKENEVLTTREKLITAIMELANDEFETLDSVMELAKESEDELIDRLIDIANYYKNESNE